MLADTDHVTYAAVAAVAAAGVQLVAPVAASLAGPDTPATPAAVVAWKARMQQPGVREAYRLRKALSEPTNAELKHRLGYARLRVRGLARVTNEMRFAATTLNLLHHGPRLLAALQARPPP